MKLPQFYETWDKVRDRFEWYDYDAEKDIFEFIQYYHITEKEFTEYSSTLLHGCRPKIDDIMKAFEKISKGR